MLGSLNITNISNYILVMMECLWLQGRTSINRFCVNFFPHFKSHSKMILGLYFLRVQLCLMLQYECMNDSTISHQLQQNVQSYIQQEQSSQMSTRKRICIQYEIKPDSMRRLILPSQAIFVYYRPSKAKKYTLWQNDLKSRSVLMVFFPRAFNHVSKSSSVDRVVMETPPLSSHNPVVPNFLVWGIPSPARWIQVLLNQFPIL